MSSNGYANTAVVGINLFRAAWTAEESKYIDSIWETFRRVSSRAPVYGLPPKAARYASPMSASQERARDKRQRVRDEAVEEMDVEVVEEDEDGKVTV